MVNVWFDFWKNEGDANGLITRKKRYFPQVSAFFQYRFERAFGEILTRLERDMSLV